LHIQLHLPCNAGGPAIRVFIAPGVQGELVAGMQGMGVNTPIAADVAADTAGLAIDLQTPNGAILTIGL